MLYPKNNLESGEIDLKTVRNQKALSQILAIAIIVIIAVAAVAAVAAYFLFLPGNPKTQTLNFSGFTALDVSSAFKVTVTQSNTYSVVITANERIFDRIEVSTEGNTLKIGMKPGTFFGIFNAEAEISMPTLRNVVFSGATRGTATGFSSAEPFGVSLSGASSLDLTNFKAGNITVDLSGASTLTADGTANDLTSVVSGASNLNLQNLAINNAEMNLSGASHAQIDVNGKLDADLSGASSLQYSGQPILGNIKTSGASTINRK
jgi:hypothetical protein